MIRRKPKSWPMYAIPWQVGDDIIKSGAWALFSTHLDARNYAKDHKMDIDDPAQVSVTIQPPASAAGAQSSKKGRRQ